MAGAMPRPMPAPLAQAPLFARDAHELRSVLDAQNQEAAALKERLAARQRECAQLRRRVLAAQGEVAVAHEATLNATERLGVHAERHGLVLSAATERKNVERTHVEHRLQRIEALLHDRDVEIARLRREAHQLEAQAHQNEMEIKGLTVATEGAASEARSLNAGVGELLLQMRAGTPQLQLAMAASRRERQRFNETEEVLIRRQEENAALRGHAATLAQEARRLEVEQQAVQERVQAFELELRAKQQQTGHQDKLSAHEAELLRQRCEELRRQLHQEQRTTVGVDQRAVLSPQSRVEAEGVKREVAALVSSVPQLAATLSARGRAVLSPQVRGDAIDEELHELLRRMGTQPPVVWRLSRGEYIIGSAHIIGSARVTVLQGQYGLLAHDPHEGSLLLQEYLHQQASVGTWSSAAG